MPRRQHRILVVEDDPTALYQATSALNERDYTVLAARDTEQARGFLSQWPIDLLIAATRVRGVSGLQFLAAARTQYPELAGILIGGDEDRPMEMDVWRHGAALIIRPYQSAVLLMTVAEKLASIRRRQRWPRKTLRSHVPLRIAGSPAALLDVSYGGLRFAVSRESYELPSPLTVDLPAAQLQLRAELVWSARATDGVSCVCGAAILDDAPAREWCQFVDGIPQYSSSA